MTSIPPVVLLLAAFLCSFVGRIVLARPASSVSSGWALAVLFAPFGPQLFRRKHKELGKEGGAWRLAASVFTVAFIAIAATTGGFQDTDRLLPPEWRGKSAVAESGSADAEDDDDDGRELAAAKASADEKPTLAKRLKFGKEVEKAAAPLAAAKTEADEAAGAPPAKAPAASPATPAAPTIAAVATPPSPTAAAAPGSVPPIAAITPPLEVPIPLSERIAANQQEFSRLEHVYEDLKRERGYLKKWDQTQIQGYNKLVAKYQADLAKARAEQTELIKLAKK